jgi:hypothetical protein
MGVARAAPRGGFRLWPDTATLPCCLREQHAIVEMSGPKGGDGRDLSPIERTGDLSGRAELQALACRARDRRPRISQAPPARSSTRGRSFTPLHPRHREGVCPLDPAIHLLPRQASSGRDGSAGGHALPHLPGRRGEGDGIDTEPGPERAAVPVPRGPPAAGPSLDDLASACSSARTCA